MINIHRKGICIPVPCPLRSLIPSLPLRLTYWVVYALFTLLEVFKNLLPQFWYSMKLGILVWAMLPQTQGAAFIYANFLKNFISSIEEKTTGDVFCACAMFLYYSFFCATLLHYLILCCFPFRFFTFAVKGSKKDT